MSEPADERTLAYVMHLFREDGGSTFHISQREDMEHLRTCPDATASHPEMTNGEYGCDTGCEYARLEAVIECPHGKRYDFEYGTFGDVGDLIYDMTRWERSAPA